MVYINNILTDDRTFLTRFMCSSCNFQLLKVANCSSSLNMSQPLKIAILQNDHKSEGYWNDFREAFCNIISAAAPDSQINFFDPIELQVYPELSDNYDLIILRRGNAEHNGNVPWVLKMQAFIRTVARNHPRQKLVGICWGHQAIHKSLGGTVGYRKEGAEVSWPYYIVMIYRISFV